MPLEKLSFKNYVWPYNPKEIVMEEERFLSEFLTPIYGNKVQDLGRKKRVVSGRGSFFGDHCFEEFSRLQLVFREGGSGFLKIPGMDAFQACFRSLKMIGDASDVLVNYVFEFWEEIGAASFSYNEGFSYHVVSVGETLFGIARRYNIPVEELVARNHFIKRPDDLVPGQRVLLS